MEKPVDYVTRFSCPFISGIRQVLLSASAIVWELSVFCFPNWLQSWLSAWHSQRTRQREKEAMTSCSMWFKAQDPVRDLQRVYCSSHVREMYRKSQGINLKWAHNSQTDEIFSISRIIIENYSLENLDLTVNWHSIKGKNNLRVKELVCSLLQLIKISTELQ